MRPLALKIQVDKIYKQRFFDKVLKVPVDDCWYWLGQINNSGYAYFKMRQKYYQASRISYAIHFGDIPQDKLALHRCDNPMCVNPDHLFLGSDKDNLLDRKDKGRDKTKAQTKTHCPKGHAYTLDNIAIQKNGNKRCKTCLRAKGKRRTDAARAMKSIA